MLLILCDGKLTTLKEIKGELTLEEDLIRETDFQLPHMLYVHVCPLLKKFSTVTTYPIFNLI